MLNTQIKELPAGLTVANLVLRGSEVRTFSTGISVETLYLTDSKVESIGPDLKVGDLYIDSTRMFNHRIECKSCQIEANSTDELIDMRNIQMEALYLVSEDSHYQIKHANAHTCDIFLAEENVACHYEFIDSTFNTMDVKIANGSTLKLGKNLKLKQMRVDSSHHSRANLNLSINQADIDDLVLSGLLTNCVISELILNGSMTIERVIDEPVLPEYGIIYGELRLPKNLAASLVHPSLCCIGNIVPLNI